MTFWVRMCISPKRRKVGLKVKCFHEFMRRCWIWPTLMFNNLFSIVMLNPEVVFFIIIFSFFHLNIKTWSWILKHFDEIKNKSYIKMINYRLWIFPKHLSYVEKCVIRIWLRMCTAFFISFTALPLYLLYIY